MDVKWLVDDAMRTVEGGGCPYIATNTILNAISLSEQDTINQYQYCEQALLKLFGGEDKKYKILYEMIENIIADERSHAYSADKAAAVLSKRKTPKGEEYNKAVEEVGDDNDNSRV